MGLDNREPQVEVYFHIKSVLWLHAPMRNLSIIDCSPWKVGTLIERGPSDFTDNRSFRSKKTLRLQLQSPTSNHIVTPHWWQILQNWMSIMNRKLPPTHGLLWHQWQHLLHTIPPTSQNHGVHIYSEPHANELGMCTIWLCLDLCI